MQSITDVPRVREILRGAPSVAFLTTTIAACVFFSLMMRGNELQQIVLAPRVMTEVKDFKKKQR